MEKLEPTEHKILPSLAYTPKDIERIELLPRQIFYRNYVSTNKPVVITNATDEWKARSLWTFEWFKNTHGKVIVPVLMPQLDKYSRAMARKSIAIEEYIDLILSDSPDIKPYLGIVELHKLIPSLSDYFKFPEYYWLRSTIFFWIGRIRTTPLHCDYVYNLLTQVVGRKRVQLYSPNSLISQLKFEEEMFVCHNKYDMEGYKAETSQLSVEPDYDITLNAGEMLFIPYGWWHKISSYEASISVNMFWATPRILLQRLQWQTGEFLKRILKSNVANK